LDESKELQLIQPDLIMIIESTSFEHIPDIRKVFKSLIERLPKGGFFLSNFTRLNWLDPKFDGFESNKKFAPEAIKIASDLMERYEWDPPQEYWDLWEKK
jgi:hypothetical protein